MMLLVAMAISVAYAASLATTIGWFDLEFWWELSALGTNMLLGHWLGMKALGQAQPLLVLGFGMSARSCSRSPVPRDDPSLPAPG